MNKHERKALLLEQYQDALLINGDCPEVPKWATNWDCKDIDAFLMLREDYLKWRFQVSKARLKYIEPLIGLDCIYQSPYMQWQIKRIEISVGNLSAQIPQYKSERVIKQLIKVI